ncbi:hypothetical protein ACQKPX_21850 [Photobacterium sp. DNB23_23_1]|uniref:Uncharacterized protein n=1 Tax=Photobacterium pectinilyticum TaxID=2906793 RepID=A0ABT1N713_9GAMM|nr:hypothetical protein [Photobacterium sp. ZSDE20]MCQ1059877.1 hypothetical protein [Photobacterium sp. ZSDE20]MDD1826468.1 hypothetical protein [Photobacterium sp. ZSDE20]
MLILNMVRRTLPIKTIFVALSLTVLAGCSSSQSQELGMRSSTVTKTPQQMSNLEICETYAFGRKATHTRVAIASEWNRRNISHAYCDKIRNELYLTALLKKLANAEEKPGSNQVQPVQPIELR